MTIVKRIFRWIGVRGWTIRRVMRALDELGVEPPGSYMNKSRRWNETQLTKIVSNDAYRPHSFEEGEPSSGPKSLPTSIPKRATRFGGGAGSGTG